MHGLARKQPQKAIGPAIGTALRPSPHTSPRVFLSSFTSGTVTRRSNSVTIIALAAILALGIVLAAHALADRFKINFTQSLPRGLYAIHSAAPIVVGDIIAVCPPTSLAPWGLSRGYLIAGPCPEGAAPFLKIVAATNGDLVDVRPDAVVVNGHTLPNSARERFDHQGRLLNVGALRRYRLTRGQFWLYSPVPHSWDSRYLGPVDTGIIGRAEPVWITGDRSALNIVVSLAKPRT